MNEQIVSNNNHEIKLIDRGMLSLTGITKIVSFNSEEFILESILGPIHITGSSLELLSLDTHDGVTRIKGKVNGFNYIEKTAHRKEESFISKLFR